MIACILKLFAIIAALICSSNIDLDAQTTQVISTQFVLPGACSADTILREYITSTPGSTCSTSVEVSRAYRNIYKEYYTKNVKFTSDAFQLSALGSSATPYSSAGFTMASLDSSGVVHRTLVSAIPITSSQITTGLGYTPLSSYTEVDPIFTASPSNGITGTNISNWNTAFGWGNHASAGYLTASLAASTYYPLTNPSGYITSASISGKVNISDTLTMLSPYLRSLTAAATYQPIGTYATASNSIAFTNKSGNISMWTNDVGYITSVPAQSFASLTGKPTTLSGYGITDAYPLSGNPSGFLTSYSENDPLFNSKLAAKSTSDLTEGTNLYYTSARFNTAFSGKSTSDLSEGSNQYYTNARARAAVSAGTGITYSSSTGVIANSAPYNVAYYTRAGSSSVTKILVDTISPSTGNGYSIDISAAGFSSVRNVQVQAEFNGSSAGTQPLVSIKSYSTTAVVVNILQSNTIGILGVLGLQFLQSVSGVRLHVVVMGN